MAARGDCDGGGRRERIGANAHADTAAAGDKAAADTGDGAARLRHRRAGWGGLRLAAADLDAAADAADVRNLRAGRGVPVERRGQS